MERQQDWAGDNKAEAADMPAGEPTASDAQDAGADVTSVFAELKLGADVVAVYIHRADADALLRSLPEQVAGQGVQFQPGKRQKGGVRLAKVSDPQAAFELSAEDAVDYWVISEPENWLTEDFAAEFRRLRADHPAPLLVLTGAAMPAALDDLEERLDLGEPEVEYVNFFRPNLAFEVLRPAPGAQTDLALRLARELEGPGIFFARSAREARELATAFHDAGIAVRLFHAQQQTRERTEAMLAFQTGQARVLVGTGVLEPPRSLKNIRYVVHAGIPNSLEEYYRQALYAGGDGRPAKAVLLFNRRDPRILGLTREDEAMPAAAEAAATRDLIAQFRDDPGPGPTLESLHKVSGRPLRKLRTDLQVLKDAGGLESAGGHFRITGDGADDQEIAAVVNRYRAEHQAAQERLKEIIHYAESSLCRKKIIHLFFGLGDVPPCGICDNCRRGTERKVRQIARRKTEAQRGGKQAEGPHVWQRGELVHHDAWGEGEIKQVWGDKLRIHFPGHGEKVLKAEFVQPA